MDRFRTKSQIIFGYFNHVFLVCMAVACFIPLWQVLMVSFSSSAAADAGLVNFWPVEFNFTAYQFVTERPEFLRSMGITMQLELLILPLTTMLSIFVAYPLSKESGAFKFRTVYVWIFVFSMLFHGGLIPSYILIKELGLLNSIWALVLPHAVPVFNIILLLNFFRNIPKELLEAAHMDGANHWNTMWRIAVPISLPALATITLFAAVMHWNSWFEGIIYMNDPEKYPLSSYLQTVIVQRDLSTATITELEMYDNLSDRTVRAAQIFLGALPILLVYPFLQRFFMKGIVMGSVKE